MERSPEGRLLLLCARAKLTVEDLQLIARDLARPDLDWDYIAKTSCMHGIAPLIYDSLYRTGVISLLSSAVAETLRNTYYCNAARNSLLYDELRRVLLAFKKKGIKVIVLKGAVLAATVYRERALRPMSDIDLLVRKEGLKDAETSVVEMGYVLGEHARTKDWREEHDYHLHYTKKSSVPVEIHWHIARPNHRFSIDIDGLWERAQLTTIAGVEALTLSVEDLLLHLCQHMHKHNLIGGIRPLCDIAHVVEHYNNTIDWMEFRTRSDQWGISPYVYLALYFAKEFLVAHIPSSFLDGFEPAGFNRAVIDWAKERLLDCESSSISHNLVQLSWNGHSFKERLAALANALSPAAVAQSYGLPQDSNRIPFHYYPQRIKDLLSRYSPLLWQLVSGDQKTRVALEKEDNQLRLNRWLSSGYQSDC